MLESMCWRHSAFQHSPYSRWDLIIHQAQSKKQETSLALQDHDCLHLIEEDESMWPQRTCVTANTLVDSAISCKMLELHVFCGPPCKSTPFCFLDWFWNRKVYNLSIKSRVIVKSKCKSYSRPPIRLFLSAVFQKKMSQGEPDMLFCLATEQGQQKHLIVHLNYSQDL